MALAPDAWVPLGEVARPHGVRGEVRVRLYNPDSDQLLGKVVARVMQRRLVFASADAEQDAGIAGREMTEVLRPAKRCLQRLRRDASALARAPQARHAVSIVVRRRKLLDPALAVFELEALRRLADTRRGVLLEALQLRAASCAQRGEELRPSGGGAEGAFSQARVHHRG